MKPCTAGSAKPHWATYFTVRDVDASAREATRLGAEIVSPLTESGASRSCGIASPQGVVFYLMRREK